MNAVSRFYFGVSGRRIPVLGLLLAFLTVVLFPSTQVRAGALEEGAGKFIESLSQQAITKLTAEGIDDKEREANFRVLLNDNFDIPVIGKWVLGRHWRKATAEERAEYMMLFEDLIVATYLNRFNQYAGEKLTLTKITSDNSKSVTVYSKIISPDQSKAVQIDWRLAVRGDFFKIVDVVVEGISMSQTQRSEFGSVIRQNGGGVGGLIQALRKKVSPHA